MRRVDVNTKAVLVILSISVLAAGCSPMFDVSANHDPEANFNAYVSYNLMENSDLDMGTAAAAEFAGRRQVMQDELVKALNRNMQAKGFKLDTENPEILVAYYVGVRNEIFVADFGFDYNDISGAAAVQTVRDGSVRIDFVDTELKKVVWSGEGHGAVNVDPTEDMIRKNVNHAVDKLLKQYPPKKSPY